MKVFSKIVLARKEEKKGRRGKGRQDGGVKGASQLEVGCLLCLRCVSFDFFLWPLHPETQAYKDSNFRSSRLFTASLLLPLDLQITQLSFRGH